MIARHGRRGARGERRARSRPKRQSRRNGREFSRRKSGTECPPRVRRALRPALALEPARASAHSRSGPARAPCCARGDSRSNAQPAEGQKRGGGGGGEEGGAKGRDARHAAPASPPAPFVALSLHALRDATENVRGVCVASSRGGGGRRQKRDRRRWDGGMERWSTEGQRAETTRRGARGGDGGEEVECGNVATCGARRGGKRCKGGRWRRRRDQAKGRGRPNEKALPGIVLFMLYFIV